MEIERLKEMAGRAPLSRIKDGMVVGLGTGTTVKYAVIGIGEMVRDGLEIVGIPTSRATETLARKCGIKLGTLDEYPHVDLTIDGADEVAPSLNLIKGGGGALLREKIVASCSREEIIVVDEGKLVSVLGERTALPVEVLPFAFKPLMKRLEALGGNVTLRRQGAAPFITDNGNYILDCKFKSIPQPEKLEREIVSIPGVVECGLFIGLTTAVYVASPNGIKVLNGGTP